MLVLTILAVWHVAESGKLQSEVVNVRLLDSNKKLLLTAHFLITENLEEFYGLARKQEINFTCITYRGFNLRGDFTFEAFGLTKERENFRVEFTDCPLPLSPSEYKDAKERGKGTPPPPPPEEEEESHFFVRVLVLLVVLVVLLTTLSAMMYYMKTLQRAQQIEEEKARIKTGTTESEVSSSLMYCLQLGYLRR
ncbi:hypothetical protein GCK32_015356 [Trichostrongylus colubriformis]|uniref:Uncharacterized protein n=1 Tax=Trichostrongylus colubriformis TaxID=6319 RepID=A0AAN8IT81_TRICO